MNTKAQHYTRTAQLLHWVMAIIFITAWIIGFYSGNFLSYDVDGSFKGEIITLHKNIAVLIIFFLVIRIFWRYTHPVPDLPDSMSPVMQKLAHIGHLVLYLILIALPVSGAIFSWSAGHPVPIVYLTEFPRLLQENPSIVAIARPVHVYLAWFAGLMIAGHILVALKHHFIDKDHVLKSMLGRDS